MTDFPYFYYIAETTAGLSTVVNLSCCELTEGKVALLSKGLKFCPIPNDLDMFNLRKDINDFIRHIQLKEYFYDSTNVEADFLDFPAFRNKSTWCPERGRELAIEVYAKAIEDEFLSQINNGWSINSNLTALESKALKDLKSYDDIVINKGSGVVVLNYREDY